MKTKNNVQKTILRSIAVILSFVMLSLTVTAQGYWMQLLTNNSFNQIASALVENSPVQVSREKLSDNTTTRTEVSDYLNEKNEVKPKTEPWMTNSWFFDLSSNSFNKTFKSVLSLGNWMLDTNYFEAGATGAASFETGTWNATNRF